MEPTPPPANKIAANKIAANKIAAAEIAAADPDAPSPVGGDVDPQPSSKIDIHLLERPHRKLLTYYALVCLLFGPFFPIAFAYAFFRYRTLRYQFDDEGVSMRWGALFRREISLTYARIQDIHLVSNIFERRLGLARLHIQTAAGASTAEMTVEGLREFEAVRDFLYEHMRSRGRGSSRPSSQPPKDPAQAHSARPASPPSGAQTARPGQGGGANMPTGQAGKAWALVLQALQETTAELRLLRGELSESRQAHGAAQDRGHNQRDRWPEETASATSDAHPDEPSGELSGEHEAPPATGQVR